MITNYSVPRYQSFYAWSGKTQNAFLERLWNIIVALPEEQINLDSIAQYEWGNEKPITACLGGYTAMDTELGRMVDAQLIRETDNTGYLRSRSHARYLSVLWIFSEQTLSEFLFGRQVSKARAIYGRSHKAEAMSRLLYVGWCVDNNLKEFSAKPYHHDAEFQRFACNIIAEIMG